MHALHSGMELLAYAKQTGQGRRSTETRVYAARVATKACPDIGVLRNYWSHLAEIHAAPQWLWPALRFPHVRKPPRFTSVGKTSYLTNR
jgi:hypothetical protein